jgi:hypothetical protein
VRPAINFTGPGVSVTDDEPNDQTVVDFSGGGIQGIQNRWATFEEANDPATVPLGAGWYYLNLGASPVNSGSGASIFGSGFHNPAGGNLQIAEAGCYSVHLQAYESSPSLSAFPATPVYYRIQTGAANGGWEGITFLRSATAAVVTLGASIDFTTYLGADESLRFVMQRGAAVPTSIPSLLIRVYIARIL